LAQICIVAAVIECTEYIVQLSLQPIYCSVFYNDESVNQFQKLSHANQKQADHLSGKPGNVSELYRCQGNVRNFTESHGNVREFSKKKSCHGKLPKKFHKYVNTLF